MQVSIITQHTVNNYGSVLQTYATQKIFEKMGHQVEFVDFWRADNLEQARVEQVLRNNRIMKQLKPFWSCTSLGTKITKEAIAKMLRKNQKNMNRFIKEKISLSEIQYTSIEQLMSNPPIADVYITGSDQVWNSECNNGIERAYFLDYAPTGRKRISFAASIGRTVLNEAEIPEMVDLLKKYDAISVREQSGVDLLAALGIQSQRILDPTLMFDGDWWSGQADYGKCPASPYLLVYQLNVNPQMDAYAETLAKKKGWRMIRIGYHHSDKRKKGHCVFCPTIPEFLGLFNKAACCLTDSFHATAFSLNFGIDFISIRPPRFETRIESLLELTGTQNRLLSDYADTSIANSTISKEAVAKTLDTERLHAWKFLEDALFTVEPLSESMKL